MNKILTLTLVLLIYSCSTSKVDRIRELRFELAEVESELSEVRYAGMDALRLFDALSNQDESQKTERELEMENSTRLEVYRLNDEENLLVEKKDSILKLIDDVLGKQDK